MIAKMVAFLLAVKKGFFCYFGAGECSIDGSKRKTTML
jgi:hypothetical protein